MNTSTDTIQSEVSFIYDEKRVQARGVLSAKQEKALDKILSDRPQALSIMRVSAEPETGGAVELVDTITDAIGVDEDEDNTEWDRVRELAAGIDRMASECASPTTILVEFIWNNGGGDDNLFGQSFLADGAGPKNEAAIDKFTEALETAGINSFYDMGTQVGSRADNYMTIDELVEWIQENGEGDEGLIALGAALTVKPAPARRARGMR